MITAGLVGVIILLGGLRLTLLAGWLCDTQLVNKSVSPSGKYTVQHSVKNCGATTDFVTYLDLGVFKREIIAIKGAHEDDLSVKWLNDGSIVVNYTGDPNKIYSYKTEVSGISIQYKAGDNDLEIKCMYHDCEAQSRQLEIQRRKEWCNFSTENRKTCDQKPGWETCDDGSWCHYSAPNG